jgi:hypothetical protein
MCFIHSSFSFELNSQAAENPKKSAPANGKPPFEIHQPIKDLRLQGEYGEKGIASFIQLATKSGICIARSMKISRNAPLQEFDAVVDSLLEDTRAKVSKDKSVTKL